MAAALPAPCHTASGATTWVNAVHAVEWTATELNSPSSIDGHDVMLCDNDDDDNESVTNDNRLLANRPLPPQLIDSYLVKTTHTAHAHIRS